jgi:predicted nucleotide-binding protein
VTNDTDPWITAAEAVRLLRPSLGSAVRTTICKRAYRGLIRARAETFMRDGTEIDGSTIPKEFWWAEGASALEQNWTTGDFGTWIDRTVHFEAFGISFLRADVEKMVQQNAGAPMPDRRPTGKIVFVGHGASRDWLELKAFLQDRLKLSVYEFNSAPIAGISTTERLSELLNTASMALLVLTAEDEQKDGTMRARENVVHEVGLFQGRLGFSKAIVLLEDGCSEFSNIHGLGQIRFPSRNISAKFEEIRAVLEREGLI